MSQASGIAVSLTVTDFCHSGLQGRQEVLSMSVAASKLTLGTLQFFNLVSSQVDMHLRVLNLQSPLPLADLLMLKKTPRLASMLKSVSQTSHRATWA